MAKRREGGASAALSIGRRALSLPTLLSFAVAAAVIALLAATFDLDWAQTLASIRSMNPWLYLLALALYYLSFAFRGARWRILALSAAAGGDDRPEVPSSATCARLIIIGWFVNSVTWLRLGDAYRAYAFAEDSKGSFSWSLGTLLAERMLDMATVAAALALSAALLAATSGFAVSRYIVVMAFVMTLAVGAVLVWMWAYGARLARFLPRRLESAYHQFHRGTLGSFEIAQLPMALLLGAVGWLLEMARLYFVLEALGIEAGLALVSVVALSHAILSTVPTPGGVGAVEPGMTGLLLIRLSRTDAAAVTIVDRSITYLSVILVGGLLFLLRQVAQLRRARMAVSDGRGDDGDDPS